MMNKGFMHSVEGIIAAILVLSYTVTVLQYPSENNEWSAVKQKQVGREFLASFEAAGLSHVIVEDRASVFTGISGYFLGVGRSYGLSTDGLLPRNIVVGVMSNESRKIATEGIGQPTGANSEYGFFNGSFRGCDFVLVDNDTGVGNGVEDYDSMYFDSNNDGVYDAYEGPKKISSAFNASGEIWVFYSVNNMTHDVEFINGADYVDYRTNLDRVVINGRMTNLSVRAITNRSELKEIDLLIVPRYMPLVGIKERLDDFLNQGNSILEVANITEDNLDIVQRDIFGLRSIDYDVDVNLPDVFDFESDGGFDVSDLSKKYYYNTQIPVGIDQRIVYLNTTWTVPNYEFDCYIEDRGIYFGHVNCTDLSGPDPCSTNVTTGLVEHIDDGGPSPSCWLGKSETRNIYYWSNFSIRRNDYFALIFNYSGDEYDRMIIDLDGDLNLTNDGPLLSEGDSVFFGTSEYEIWDIYRDGSGFELRPILGNTFVKTDYEKLYTNNNDTEYVILESPDEYYSTSYSMGAQFIVDTPTVGSPCNLKGVSANDYHYNSSWQLPYTIVVLNITSGFNAFVLNLDGDPVCGGSDEGPFYSGDTVRVGPEYYRVDVALDGLHVNWTLVDRWNVPYAIVNHRGGFRKTVWINDDIYSLDEWHIIKSAIVWAANKESNLLLAADALDTVVVKDAFIEDREMFQPYGVYFRMGA